MLLDRLAARQVIEEPVALVVAHPDDETLALGGSLSLFRRLLLVHVTDGAPRRLADMARKGFPSPGHYARARADELALALALSECGLERHELQIADQDAVDEVGRITVCLQSLFQDRKIGAVLTHAFEGGHPDHDAVAMAVHAVGLPVYEFPLYHGAGGGMTRQTFLPDGEAPRDISLSPSQLSRKRAMLACFATQADTLSQFDPATERLRPAPAYDWAEPPHAPPLLYEAWGWLTFAEWRDRAQRSRCAA